MEEPSLWKQGRREGVERDSGFYKSKGIHLAARVQMQVGMSEQRLADSCATWEVKIQSDSAIRSWGNEGASPT